jgi:hypothetical protein
MVVLRDILTVGIQQLDKTFSNLLINLPTWLDMLGVGQTM